MVLPEEKGHIMRKQSSGSGCVRTVFAAIALIIVFVVVIVIAPLTQRNKTVPPQPEWYQKLQKSMPSLPSLSSLSNAISKPAQAAQSQILHGSNASYIVTGSQSLTSAQIDAQLCSKHSPACGTGQTLHDLGLKYNIDAVYPLAFFWHESNYGTQGVARFSKSIGNMRCIPTARCVGGYAYFASWQAGEQAWYQLIVSRTYVGGGRVTVAQIIPVYAPAADSNNEQAYISSVEQNVDQLRNA